MAPTVWEGRGSPRQTKLTMVAMCLFLMTLVTVPRRAAARSQQMPGGDSGQAIRFAVAHHHSMSWCYGYLYVTARGIRYEVVQPQKDKGHSFDATRSELQVARQWVVLGEPQEAIELRIGHSTYHFRVLANEAAVQSARARPLSPPEAVPPDALLAAIQDPAPALVAAQQRVAARPQANAGATPAPEAGPGAAHQPQVPRGLPAGALDGVYVGLEFSQFFAGSINHRFLIFYPDGWVMDGMPPGGLDGFNFSSYARDPKNQGSVGRYRVDGKQISIIWQDSPTNREFVQRDEGAADFGGPSVYIPLCRCDGLRLSGTYEWDQKTALQFSLDGRFVDRGAIDELVTELGFYNHPRLRSGTYTIHNNTLILNFSDGGRIRTSFAASALQESSRTFNWISILSYQTLYRQGYRPAP